jgi:hypothetical protein
MILARIRVSEALAQCPQELLAELLHKSRGIQACGKFAAAALVTHDGHVTGVIRNRCRCRGCAVCDSLLASETRRVLELIINERVEQGARMSMITLTLPHKRSDSAEVLVDWLFKGVHRFQRSNGFRRHVRGWVRGVEMPWSEANGFHPHAHYLVEASMWPKDEMKAEWTNSMLAIGGPYVPPHGAHIMEIKDAGKGLMEAIGYPFKIYDLSTMPPIELCHLLHATKCRHLTQLCRLWSKRVKVLLEQAGAAIEDACDDGSMLKLSFQELHAQVKAGNRTAFSILVEAAEWLTRNWSSTGLGAQAFQYLRAAAEEHGWPVPELPEGGSGLLVKV